MTCETIRKELVAYRDGELRERDRAQIAAHLSTCAACAREEARLSALSRKTPAAPHPAQPPVAPAPALAGAERRAEE